MSINNKSKRNKIKMKKRSKLDIEKLEKKFVSRKLMKASFSTKLVAFIIFVNLSIAFGVFAYFYAGVIEGKLGVEGEATFTISKALAHGNKPGFIILTFLGFCYLIYLLALRGPIEMFVRRVFFLSISFSLFLLMGILNMIAYVCLIIFAVLRGSLESDIFAGFEILFAVLFLSTIMIIGYY